MRTRETTISLPDSIAVIGMQGRFPGAGSVDELWENLRNGVESIATFSEDELRAAGIDPSYIGYPGYVNRGSVIEAIDKFDAGFFGYSARDAETMDPQQRIFLECAWEALENAGCDPDTYPGMIGVFAGSDQSSYLYQIYSSVDLSAYGYGGMMAIGNEKDYLATQVSYKLNLRGPALNVQTSCSTSLVAVCVACQNLALGYCDVALAGGAAIGVPQKKGYWYQAGGIVSPDGHCRTFDAAGQGTVVGSGVGVVVLKRLSDALADGDRIEAVIKGFALNNDGAGKVGYTAPSVDGQAAAIRMAQKMAGVEPETIGYVEAHGTATALGDPVEIAALTKAFRERTAKRQYCAVGSLKSNVGHLSSAAGVSGLIKGVLAVRHGQIPKTLHYEKPNPQIDFAGSPFFVASELMDWPVRDGPRRAGVSSFGVGGTNAHVVLEQAPPMEADRDAPEKQLLVLSARTPAALEAMTDNLARHLEDTPGLDLADVAFTLQAGRKAFPHRRFLTCDRSDRAGTVATLRERDPARMATGHTELRERAVVFMFSGQGTQYVDMGRELYETENAFRGHVDECCEILKGELGADLRDLLYPGGDREGAAERLKQTEITQPALFTIEYALARLWMGWGVTPNAMLGHSIGEYVAACLAGVMSLEDALSVVAMRGRLMASMPGGGMLAVPLPEAALQPLLNPLVSLAAVNAPGMCVLSGPTEVIDALEADFGAKGMPCSRLRTSHAFHSTMMDPVLGQFAERLRRVSFKPPRIAYLSNVTGTWITPQLAASPEYWAAHLRQTVRFADDLREVMAFPDLALVEVGPGQTLGMLARQQGSRASSQLIVPSLPAPQEGGSDAAFIRASLGRLWLGGTRIDWRGFHEGERRGMVVLPTYPFERQRFWVGPLEDADEPGTQPASVALSRPVSLTGEPVPAAPAPAPATARTDIADWFHIPTWKPAVGAGSRARTDAQSGPWLVFLDAGGLGEAVCGKLRAEGLTANAVACGESFGAEGERFTIRPGERADYRKLVEELRRREEVPARILHLWCADEEPGDSFDEAQKRGFLSLIALAQAMAKSAGSTPVQIGVVTAGLQAVLGDEKLRSAEATVAGACKVVPQEYPNLRCRLIDVVPSDAGSPARLAANLVDEMTREPFEASVAYRNGRRWVQAYEPVRLEEAGDRPAILEDGGVYLITGGLGNIGLTLAEAIARTAKARLALVGRSPFPDRSDWDALSASGSGDANAARIRRLKEIEALGAEVMVVQGDVLSRPGMRTAVAAIRKAWGPVRGVVHGAANLSPDAFKPVKETDRAAAYAHFRTKDQGLLVLEEVLADEPPALWVLLSSISSVLGGLNLAAYAGANAFLDAEAQRRNAEGNAVWISVNWDAWDFSPQAGAKADAIPPAQGQDAFRRILASSLRQVVVAASPLPERLAKWVALESVAKPAAPRRPTEVAADVNARGEVHARPQLGTSFEAPRTATEKKVAEVWEHFLGVAPVGIHDKFFELGGHSLLAIQLLDRLRELFEMDIPVQRIFEAPTVSQLAASIDRDRAEVPALADLAGDGGADLEAMLNLVESLSEEEVDALLNEADAMQRTAIHHG